MLSLVMNGLKMMEPKTETLAGTMEQIINFVSDYNNGKNGVPYKDGIHKSDRDIIKGNEKLQCNSDIWFASRYIVPTSSHTYFAVRSLGKNNVEGAQSLYIDRNNALQYFNK